MDFSMEINMKIGIVTTWFERGAAYVSRAYMDNLVNEGHEVFIYARGGEIRHTTAPKWNESNVTWGKVLQNVEINERHFFQWIRNNKLDAVLFNEQQHFKIVARTKKEFPTVKVVAYIDYYTEKLIPWYNIYDFVICNTKRHMQAMDNHPQSFYLRWGTDTELFTPSNFNKNNDDQVVFFHSAGMSDRKGTDVLLKAYINNELYTKAKLIIHTQLSIDSISDYTKEELESKGIEVIEKTVTAPGLYYMGDVYIYPTRLDGLGLTMYEALASGMPVITTDYPPMNEIIHDGIGKLVKVERNYSRIDAYYWPMSVCDEASLVECMEYYINNKELLREEQKNARREAEEFYEWRKQSKALSAIFEEGCVRDMDNELYNQILAQYKRSALKNFVCENETLLRIALEVKSFIKKV